jgi:glucose-1-phosphate cytidylyltransferase
MIEIGGRPILWHIMKGYASAGLDHFVIALGYKGEMIKSFFVAYSQVSADVTVDTRSGTVTSRGAPIDSWTIDLVDSGPVTETGGRIKRLAGYLPDPNFCCTYGDGVGNIDLRAVLDFHREHGRIATLTAVRPPARFGALVLDGEQVADFSEKPQIGEGWINGGFMVFRRDILDWIEGDHTVLEVDVFERLAREGELMAYRHDEFWHCMDTLRDIRELQSMWESERPPWRTWE